MSKVFLHIGYPKTATTTLQKHVFSTSNDLLFLGKPFEKQVESWIYDMCYNTSLDYSHDDFQGWIQDVRDKSSAPIFLSHEGFLMPSAQDLKIICERIRTVFGSCHIVLTLRNQWDLVSSFYYSAGLNGAHLFGSGVATNYSSYPLSVNEWVEANFVNKSAPLKFHHKSFFAYLNYYKVIHYLRSLFGEGNVSILFFENFKQNESLFIRQFEDMLGCEFSIKSLDGKHENKTFYQGMNWKAWVDRIYHKLSGDHYLFKQKLGADEMFKLNLKQEFRVELEAYFSQSNSLLQRELGVDLKGMRYPL